MIDLRDAQAEIHGALRHLETHTPFAEALAQAETGWQVQIDRTGPSVRIDPVLSGVAFRAWAGDHWVETAAGGVDPRSLKSAIEGLSRRLASPSSKKSAPGAPATGHEIAIHPPRHPMDEKGIEEWIARAEEYRAWARAVPGVSDGRSTIGGSTDSRLYLNTVGAERYQVVPRAFGGAVAVAMENGTVRFDVVRPGGMGGQEILEPVTEAAVHEASKSAVALLHAKTAPAGPTAIVLDPSTAGTLAHESFGHGTEADQFVRHRSYLQPILGTQVGPEFLSIVDDGSYPGGWGSYYFDDEGTKPKPTYLIDHGRFVGVLHDRTTAAALGGTPTGNARRSDFLSRLWVRMTNTYIAPGDRSREELIEEARNGILLEQFTSGVEDPLGGLMQIRVLKGRRIEQGKETDLLGAMALSGRVLDVLRSVRGVSRMEKMEMEIGYCGKGHSDYIPVGSSAAYLLTDATVGPA